MRDQNFYEFNESKSRDGNRIYYSGANVKVYFGNVWVKELASIQFSVEENVAPVYGFNSYMFDKVARGTRIVNGAFMINHTEAGYLPTILEHINKNIDFTDASSMWDNQLQYFKQDVEGLGSNTNIENIENIIQFDTKGKYEDYIQGLKNSFWGPQEVSGNTVHRNAEAREYDTNYFPREEGSKYDSNLKTHGFNILLDYSPSANERDFEECIKHANNEGSISQTYRSIIGVHITGENQIISPDGQPIQTQYNFVARDIDGDVTQLSMKYNQLHNESSSLSVPIRTDDTPVKKPSVNTGGGGGSSGAHGDQITILPN